MNFKTTAVLAILLLVLGGYVWLTRDAEPRDEVVERERRLFDISAADISRVAIAPADGNRIVLEKSGDAWRLVEPVNAPADTFEVDSLLRAVTNLRSRSALARSAAKDAETGLAQPRYNVELTAGQTTLALAVGNRTAVGDHLYVALHGAKDAEVVGVDLLDRLQKPLSAYRDSRLVNVSASQVRNVTIQRGDQRIVLERQEAGWRMTQPTLMPAEETSVDDVIFAVTGLRAVEWVSEDAADAPKYQLERPRVKVVLATDTEADEPVTVRFGDYDDVLQRNVYVTTSGSDAIAKVSATALEALSKKALELRDRRVLHIVAEQVSGLAIVKKLAAKDDREASRSEVIIRRRSEATALGPAAPSESDADEEESVEEPLEQTPPSRWEILDTESVVEAEDFRVDDLLLLFAPLRAERYVESAPETESADVYTLTVTTTDPGGSPSGQHTIRVIDRGSAEVPIAQYQELTFEVSRTLVQRMQAEFRKAVTSPQAHEEHGEEEL